MGQAKARGTYEERVAQAKARIAAEQQAERERIEAFEEAKRVAREEMRQREQERLDAVRAEMEKAIEQLPPEKQEQARAALAELERRRADRQRVSSLRHRSGLMPLVLGAAALAAAAPRS